MEDEYGARDRTAPIDLFSTAMRDVKFKYKNSDERFKTLVEAMIDKFRNENITSFSGDDIEKIFDSINNLNKPGYKNATAFILGYLFRKNNMTKRAFKGIQGILNDASYLEIIKSYPMHRVTGADVIRYARLHQTLNSIRDQ